MDFVSVLSSPIWAVIAAIATVIAIFISIRQQQRKGISYKVVTDTPLLSLKEEVKGRVQVLFDAKPVGNSRLVVLKIFNSGNVPILPTDYIEPIKLGFGVNTEILDSEVLETVPTDIKDKAKAPNTKDDIGGVMLEPLLLNSRDSITLKVLLAQTHLTKEVKVTGRIVGIKQILNVDKLPPIFLPLARTFTYVSYIVFLAIIIYLQFSRYERSFINILISILTIIILALIYIFVYTIIAAIINSIVRKESVVISIKYMVRKIMELGRYMVYGSEKR
jgi:hypothetical protein